MPGSTQLDVRVAPLTFLGLHIANKEKERKLIKEIEQTLSTLTQDILKYDSELKEILKKNDPELSNTPLLRHRITINPDNLVHLSLDFFYSPLQTEQVKFIVNRIKELPEWNKSFVLKHVPLAKDFIGELLQRISDNLKKNQRTTPETKNSKKFLFKYTVEKADPKTGKNKWNLLLNFADSPLNHAEIQKGIWDIILANPHRVFDIVNINFSNSNVIIQKLTDSSPNEQYGEVKGKKIGDILHETVQCLNLSDGEIDRRDLPALQQFKNLNKLYLDNCEQEDPSDPVTEEDVWAALPNLQFLSMEEPIQSDASEKEEAPSPEQQQVIDSVTARLLKICGRLSDNASPVVFPYYFIPSDGLLRLYLDFLNSYVDPIHADRIIQEMKTLQEYNQSFTMESSLPKNTFFLSLFTEIGNALRKDEGIPQEELIFTYSCLENPTPVDIRFENIPPTEILLDFKISHENSGKRHPLNTRQIQKIFWDLIYKHGFKQLFNVTHIKLDNKRTPIELIFNSRHPQDLEQKEDGGESSQPERDAPLLAAFYQKITFIDLGEGFISHANLSCLKQFKNLRNLFFDMEEQRKILPADRRRAEARARLSAQAIVLPPTLEEIQEALPNVKLHSLIAAP